MAAFRRASYRIVSIYVLREFALSLLVSFIFFFFIFFINQILLLAQKILIKNVDIGSVLRLIGLAIPQILLYTLPFSSLTASSMVIGELSSRNEILALRCSGISMTKLFRPIVVCAVCLSLLTFAVADILLPYSSQRYVQMYSELLQDLPTIELESWSVNRVENKILVTGQVEGSTINNLVMFDVPNQGDATVISAQKADITLIDLEHLMYRLDLHDPVLLSTDSKAIDEFSFSKAGYMTYYLDFSSQMKRLTDVTPSQMSSKALREAISERQSQKEKDDRLTDSQITTLETRIADLGKTIASDQTIQSEDINEIIRLSQELESLKAMRSINFYLQYYRAELHKKMALSAACFFLVFITFPLSFFRIKHGRLFGFGLSLLVACAYWFMLFYAQMQILDYQFNPGFLIWAPDAIIFLISLILIVVMRRT